MPSRLLEIPMLRATTHSSAIRSVGWVTQTM